MFTNKLTVVLECKPANNKYISYANATDSFLIIRTFWSINKADLRLKLYKDTYKATIIGNSLLFLYKFIYINLFSSLGSSRSCTNACYKTSRFFGVSTARIITYLLLPGQL